MESIKDIVAKNCQRLLDESVNLAEVARLMQVSPSTVSRWKSGKHAPELDKIDKLADLLKVDQSEFFAHEKKIKPITMSHVAARITSVPDEIYECALILGPDHKIWKDVKGLLKRARDEAEAKKSNQA